MVSPTRKMFLLSLKLGSPFSIEAVLQARISIVTGVRSRVAARVAGDIAESAWAESAHREAGLARAAVRDRFRFGVESHFLAAGSLSFPASSPEFFTGVRRLCPTWALAHVPRLRLPLIFHSPAEDPTGLPRS